MLDNNTPLFQADIEEAGYEPRKATVRNIRLQVRAGERVGLLGPNGAGKSTIMKGLLGQLPHWDGKIYWRGEEIQSEEKQAQLGTIGYIPEQPILYERLTLHEHLSLAAAANGLTEEVFRERAERLLRRFRMEEALHRYPVKFSKGMQQKVMLIVGFLLQPELYLVDEPFIGLDPSAVMELLDALDEERERGAAVLLTTHVLDSAQRLCDTFVLINNGGLSASGTIDDVRTAAGAAADASLFDCFRLLIDRDTRGRAAYD